MPTGSITQPLDHTFTAPPLEEASVVDAMRVGIVSCLPDTTAREVARTMATYRIHSVVVSEMDGAKPLGVISDVDIAAAAAAGDLNRNARELARSAPVSVAADDPLDRGAKLMAEHGISHLVVIQPHSGHPVGVLSALDIAGVMAWGGKA